MKRNHKLFVEDILECLEKIDEFLGSMDFEQFMEDDKTKSAVVRKLEIIGEAAKNIPKQIRQKYKELPWTDMAGMRDKIATSILASTIRSFGKLSKEDCLK